MHRRLGELLTDGGFISEKDLQNALRECERSGRSLEDVLISSGKLSATECQAVRRVQSLVSNVDTALHLSADEHERLDNQLHKSGHIDRRQYERLHEDLRSDPPESPQELEALLRRDTQLDAERIAACLRAPAHEDVEMRGRARMRLGELLVDSGDISPDQLQRALAEQRSSHEPIGKILIEHGWLTPRRMRRAVRLQRRLAAAAFGAAMAFSHVAFAAGPDQAPMPDDGMMVATLDAGTAADQRFASLTDLQTQVEQKNQRRLEIKRKKKQQREALALARAERIAKQVEADIASGNTQLDSETVMPWVKRYAAQHKISVDLVLAVIHTESNFRSDAHSRANAVGLMQLIPRYGGRAAYTYLRGKKTTPSREELSDPQVNIKLGTAYLRLLSDRYFKDIRNAELRDALVLAAYNWGPTRVLKLLDRHGTPTDTDSLQRLLNRHAPDETANYVAKVTQRRALYEAESAGALLARR